MAVETKTRRGELSLEGEKHEEGLTDGYSLCSRVRAFDGSVRVDCIHFGEDSHELEERERRRSASASTSVIVHFPSPKHASGRQNSLHRASTDLPSLPDHIRKAEAGKNGV